MRSSKTPDTIAIGMCHSDSPLSHGIGILIAR